MANNRYYLYCDCGSVCYVGKSTGNGVFAVADDILDLMHEWMWKHIIYCEHALAPRHPVLGPEWATGEIFKVLTEGDERVKQAMIKQKWALPEDMKA